MNWSRESFGKRDRTTADEFDRFSHWKKYLNWRAGEARRIKQDRHRRERKQAKRDIRRESE